MARAAAADRPPARARAGHELQANALTALIAPAAGQAAPARASLRQTGPRQRLPQEYLLSTGERVIQSRDIRHGRSSLSATPTRARWLRRPRALVPSRQPRGGCRR
jgi:hypothetical protein